MSRSYIFTHQNATPLINASREEILANEPTLLAIDQHFDFENIRSDIEGNLATFKKVKAMEENENTNCDKQNIADENRESDILTPMLQNTHIKSKYARANAGRPGYDPVLMYKIIVLKVIFNLSDNNVVRSIKDRRSFQVFLGIDESVVPDSKTVWKYNELFVESGLFQQLFEKATKCIGEIQDVKDSDSIGIDSSFTLAEIQRNSREENKLIKEGNGEALWIDNPAKKRQKDIDASWTQKGGQHYFGYKLHAAILIEQKLITAIKTTPAHVHDSQVISPLIRDCDIGRKLYADSAYSGQKQISEIQQLELIPEVCEKGKRNKPLTDEQKASNRQKSKLRARVEHVFGQLAHWSADEIRSIGIKRADAYHHIVAWCYNLTRLITLKMPIPF